MIYTGKISRNFLFFLDTFISFKLKHKEAWCAAVYGVAKSRIRLNDWSVILLFSPHSPPPHHSMHLDYNRKEK